MKLRFRQNSLRLRVNRREVESLASGAPIQESVHFPGDACISYVLAPTAQSSADASFEEGVIRVLAPQTQVEEWAQTDSIGMYFDFPANNTSLKVAIEKDLECIDGPAEERDPDAFSRTPGKNC